MLETANKSDAAVVAWFSKFVRNERAMLMLSKISSLCRNAGVRKKLANAETPQQVVDVLWNESTAKGLGVSRRAISAFVNDLNLVKRPSDLHLETLMFRRWDPSDTGIRQPCGGTKRSCNTKRINQPGC